LGLTRNLLLRSHVTEMATLFRKLAIASFTVLLTVALLPASHAKSTKDNAEAPYCTVRKGKDCDVDLTRLPREAQEVHTLIAKGGPFRYEHKDGTVFGNRESMLPKERRGYYREYTVRTPGSRDRGARRIVCGGVRPTTPDNCYYTDDHYTSFRRIVASK
jgi:ribonuclease T1